MTPFEKYRESSTKNLRRRGKQYFLTELDERQQTAKESLHRAF